MGGSVDMAMRSAFESELGVKCRLSFDKREPQLHEGPSKVTYAPTWEDLDKNMYTPEGEDYALYNKLYEDWFKPTTNTGQHNKETTTTRGLNNQLG